MKQEDNYGNRVSIGKGNRYSINLNYLLSYKVF